MDNSRFKNYVATKVTSCANIDMLRHPLRQARRPEEKNENNMS